MTSSTITQPATAGAPLHTRPVRVLTFGKLFGLVVAIGTVVALVIAGGLGLAALVLTNTTG
jgi:hypothetical protein